MVVSQFICPSSTKAAAIVGACESLEIGYPDEPKTPIQLHMEAIKGVSEQTGIPISDIDGVFSAGMSSEIAEHLGIHPRYIDTTQVGGCSFEMHPAIDTLVVVTQSMVGWDRWAQSR